MNIYSAIILCFVPLVTVFLLLKILVEGISIVKELLACLIGLIAVIPITVLQFCFGDLLLFKNNLFFSLLFRSVVLYGLIEEGIKGGTLFLFPVKKIDGRLMFYYSILAGLFLGCFESVIYVLRAIQDVSSHGGEVLLHLIFIRSFTAIVIHSFCASLLGMFVYGIKNKKAMICAALSAVLLHGLYDFFVILNSPINYFAYAAIALLLLETRLYYVKIKNIDSELGKI